MRRRAQALAARLKTGMEAVNTRWDPARDVGCRDFVDPREALRDIYPRQMKELEQRLMSAATPYERSKVRCQMVLVTWLHRIGWRAAHW
jgi:hypothetical protein